MDEEFDLSQLYDKVKAGIGIRAEESIAIDELAKELQQPLIELECIGEGGVKTIRKCFDPKNKRYVATARTNQQKHDNHLIYEAWVLSALNHPHIISLYDLNLDAQKRPYFVMNYVEGQDLADYQKQNLTLNDRLKVFHNICEAMAHAHEHHIVHLDLKPQNILCSHDGHLSLCDWGLARYIKMDGTVSINSEEHLHLYAADHTVATIQGSPGYMAPEQILNDAPVGVQSDIFALGGLLFFLITGEAPFSGTLEQRIEKTKQGDLKTIQQSLLKHVQDHSLIAIILKCLASDQATRYKSVNKILSDLNLHRTGHITSADPPSKLFATLRFLSRNRSKTLMLSALFVFTTLTSTIFISSSRSKNTIYENSQMRLNDSTRKIETLYSAIKNNPDLKQEINKTAHRKIWHVENFDEYSQAAHEVEILLEPLTKTSLGNRARHHYILDYINAIRFQLADINPNSELGRYFKPYLSISRDSEKERPSQEQFNTYFQEAFQKDLDPRQKRIHEFIIAYDHSLNRADVTYFVPVMHMIKSLNRQEVEIEQCDTTGKISIESRNTQILRLKRPESHFSLLSYLKAESIFIRTNQEFDTSQLHGATCQTLDLTGVKRFTTNQTEIHMPNLRKVIVHSIEQHDHIVTILDANTSVEIIVI